jgi:hypothetical protein
MGGARAALIALIAMALIALPTAAFCDMATIHGAAIILCAMLTCLQAIAVLGTTLLTIVIPSQARGLWIATLVAATVLFGEGLAPLLVSVTSAALGTPASMETAVMLVCGAASALAAAAFAWSRVRM